MRWLYWYKYTIIWGAVILLLSWLPANEFDNKQVDGFDLVVHFLFYSLFTWLLIIANVRRKQESGKGKRLIVWSIVVSVLFGGMVEIVQGTVFVTRMMDWGDFVANTIGTFSAAGIFYVVYGSPESYC